MITKTKIIEFINKCLDYLSWWIPIFYSIYFISQYSYRGAIPDLIIGGLALLGFVHKLLKYIDKEDTLETQLKMLELIKSLHGRMKRK